MDKKSIMDRDTLMASWQDTIRCWYPDVESNSYFIPPVIISSLSVKVKQVDEQSVLVLQPPSSSEAQSQTPSGSNARNRSKASSQAGTKTKLINRELGSHSSEQLIRSADNQTTPSQESKVIDKVSKQHGIQVESQKSKETSPSAENARQSEDNQPQIQEIEDTSISIDKASELENKQPRCEKSKETSLSIGKTSELKNKQPKYRESKGTSLSIGKTSEPESKQPKYRESKGTSISIGKTSEPESKQPKYRESKGTSISIGKTSEPESKQPKYKESKRAPPSFAKSGQQKDRLEQEKANVNIETTSAPSPIQEQPTASKIFTAPFDSGFHPVKLTEYKQRSEQAQQNLLFCLQNFARKNREAMFVMSELDFSDYLGQPCYSAAAKYFLRPGARPGVKTLGKSTILRESEKTQTITEKDNTRQKDNGGDASNPMADSSPTDKAQRDFGKEGKHQTFTGRHVTPGDSIKSGEPKEEVKKDDNPENSGTQSRNQLGDFDILMIHRKYGLLTGEVKAISSDSEKSIKKRIAEALKQLNKSEDMIRYLTSDLLTDLTVRKILILPFISRQQLEILVNKDKDLRESLMRCLVADSAGQAVDLCLLYDHLTEDTSRMQEWWRARVADKVEPRMTSDLYLNLLARFCGPATSVKVYCITPPPMEVRTEAGGVSLVGERMALLILTREQVDLLTRKPPKVILTGPPGVGKSVVMCLMAMHWMRIGRDVHIASLTNYSLPACRLLKYMLGMTLKDDRRRKNDQLTGYGRLHFHRFDILTSETKMTDAVQELAKVEKLHVICEEFWVDHRSKYPLFHQFVKSVCEFEDLTFWLISMRRFEIPPELKEEKMSTPLRYPPLVLREVQEGTTFFRTMFQTYEKIDPPCFGPNALRLSHVGPIHRLCMPTDCRECGLGVAGIIKKLGVRLPAQNTSYQSEHVCGSHSETVQNCNTATPPPLLCQDVFVLSGCGNLCDDVKDAAGNVISPGHGVVRGLRESGVPVCVVTHNDDRLFDKHVSHTAVAKRDEVTVAYYGFVSSLERKVVIYLPHRNPISDDRRTRQQIEASGRLHALSRCTSQIILVEVPDFLMERIQVIKLQHRPDEHGERWPTDCVECGQNVAQVLKTQLGVGQVTNSVSNEASSSTTTTNTPAITYQDVYVVSECTDLCDAIRDPVGRVTTRASGVVCGLREAGIPVSVVLYEDQSHDVTSDKTLRVGDTVVVANYAEESALQRKVVVYLPHGRSKDSKVKGEGTPGWAYVNPRCTAIRVEIDVEENKNIADS